MSVTFTKLFSSITESTVWCEPDSTRIVWITMLAMADQKGRVWGSIPGLANRARVTVEQCEKALITFSSPDKYSRTPDNEGRRIEDIDGGWRLLNYEKHRAVRDEESIKESKRNYINNRRAAERMAGKAESVESVEKCRTPSIQAEAEAEAEEEKSKATSKTTTRAPRYDAIASLSALGVSDQIARDWIKHRTTLKTTVTQTVIDGIAREAAKARIALSDALAMSCERGWRGFKAEWVAEAIGQKPRNGSARDERDARRDHMMEVLTGRKNGVPKDPFIGNTIEGELL